MENSCENSENCKENCSESCGKNSEMLFDENEIPACCSGRTKERAPEEFKSLMNRLNRIEGQVKGIRRMLENDAYCPDILVQVSAANAALNAFSKLLLKNHIHTCVVNDIKAGKTEVVDELCEVLQKMMR